MGKDDNDDLDEIVYKGMVPPDSQHDSFFGNKGGRGKGTHFTAQEGQTFERKERG